MKIVWLRVLPALLLWGSVSFCCAPGAADVWLRGPADIVGGYQLVECDVGAYVKYSGRTIVGPAIVSLGWNSDFILVEQLPMPEEEQNHNWFIIDALRRETYGPLTYEEYRDLRSDLSVPNDIEMLSIERAWREAPDPVRREFFTTVSICFALVGIVILIGFVVLRKLNSQFKRKEQSSHVQE